MKWLMRSLLQINKMGFFAEVGPLNIFISNHLIPNDFKFEPNSMPPCYISEDQVKETFSFKEDKFIYCLF